MVWRKCVRHREGERESTKECLSDCLPCEKPDSSLQMWSGLFNTTYKYPFVFCSAPNQAHPPTAPKPTSHHDRRRPCSPSICFMSDPSFPQPLQGLALNITSPMLQLHGAKLHREGPSAFSMWSRTALPREDETLTETRLFASRWPSNPKFPCASFTSTFFYSDAKSYIAIIVFTQ